VLFFSQSSRRARKVLLIRKSPLTDFILITRIADTLIRTQFLGKRHASSSAHRVRSTAHYRRSEPCPGANFGPNYRAGKVVDHIIANRLERAGVTPRGGDGRRSARCGKTPAATNGYAR